MGIGGWVGWWTVVRGARQAGRPGRAGGPGSTVRGMDVPSRELTAEDLELIEFARAIVDAYTDGEDGVHTMGAAVRGADGTMYGGINLYHFTGGRAPSWWRSGMPARRGHGSSRPSSRSGTAGGDRSGRAGRTARSCSTITRGSGVILPTPDGIRSVRITDLMPLGAVWTPDEGTQAFDPGLFGE